MRDRCLICGDPAETGNCCDRCRKDALFDLVSSEPLIPEPEFYPTNRKARRAQAAMRRKW